MTSLVTLTLILIQLISRIRCDNFDVLIDAKATSLHRVDSLNLLIYCKGLLIEKNIHKLISRIYR